MKNYTVTLRYVVNVSMDVQAEDEDHAEELAWIDLHSMAADGDEWLHEGEWTETFITEQEAAQ